MTTRSMEVESWVFEEKPHYIEKLPTGDYTLREVTAPEGYEVAEDVRFKVDGIGDDRSPLTWLLLFGFGTGIAGTAWAFQKKDKEEKHQA